MDKGAVFVATCIAAAASTLVMALYANYPIALAPGMGLNAFFAFTVVLTMREGCSLFQSNTVKYVYVARKAGRTACDQRTAQIIAAGNPEIASTDQAKRLYEYGCVTEMDIVQLIYRPTEPQGALKNFQFGRSTMEARWQQGLSDARTTLHASPWLAPMPKELGVRVFDVIHEILDIVNARPKLVRFRANSGHTDFMSMRHGPLALAIGKRLLQGQKIPPGKPLLQGAAQQERGMERGERADFAAAGLIGKPASP